MSVSQFSELSLRPEILRSISEMGFETPSPIQAQAIPLMLGREVDFLGLAGTGTGKTAAFAIPLLERIDTKARDVQALILCPTRELALQVAGQISLLGKYLRVKVATVYGGAPYAEQIRALKGGAQIVVGTPGRVIDHLERATLKLDSVRTLILDEADEMFSMGFKEEIDRVVEMLDGANTWLFSATMSPEVRRVVNSSLHNPVTVQVSKPNTLATGVEQYFYRVNEPDKPELVCKLIEAADEFYGIIFCQTKALVADLTRFMLDRGYKVDCLHGDMDQNSRERTMQAFRDKKLSVLVCTDVAARGLDVKDITHVVNYSLPRELESYVHRIGRTARSGKTGTVMNLVTYTHRHLIGRIEQHTRAQMKEGFVPTKREIAAKKVARLLPTFANQPFASRVLEVMGEDFRAQLASMTPEQVASHFIVMMLPDIFSGEAERASHVARAKRAARAEARESQAQAPVVPPAPVADVSAESAVATAKLEVVVSAPEVTVAETPVAVAPAQDVTPLAKLDLFGDEVVEKKKKAATIDQPPRARKKPLLDEDEIAAMLEEPATFGVRKEREERPARRAGFSRERRNDDVPRSQSQFRGAGPRESRFERTARPSRPAASSRPAVSTRPAVRAPRASAPSRPSAPMNLGKPPKHEAGPARTARQGETGGLNRRARRALLFGRPVDGANESTN